MSECLFSINNAEDIDDYSSDHFGSVQSMHSQQEKIISSSLGISGKSKAIQK